MSELSIDSIIPETQEKDDRVTANDHDSTANSTLNESQDFHLVAEDDTQECDVNESGKQGDEVVKVKQNADAKPVEESRDGDKTGAKVSVEPESTTDDVLKNDSVKQDEDEEVVQCTPTEDIFSPRRRPLTGASQKRKADDEEEQSMKFQRTSSREDALASVRRKLDSLDRSQESEVTSEPSQTSPTKSPEKPASSAKPAEDPPVAPEEPSIKVDEAEKAAEEPAKSSAPEKTPAEVPQPSAIDEKPEEKREEPMEVDSTTAPAEEKPKDPEKPEPSKKSRMSIEVIYDKALAPPPKPRELVEIDEDGEKIVLDSSQEEPAHVDTSYKTCESKSIASDSYKSIQSKSSDSGENQLTNGSEKKSDGDATVSVSSEANESSEPSSDSKSNLATPSTKKPPEVLNLISDSEGDSFVAEEKAKAKLVPVEKEISLVVKVKCLLQVTEGTKEIAGKELLTVDFENLSDLHLSRRRNSDASALADVSDNKDATSPGSVTSNPQPYPLNPSRLSLMSLASTSSSSSSGSSKIAGKDSQFSLPRGLPKHAKKVDSVDEASEKLKREWKNHQLLTAGILSFVNTEVLAADLHNGTSEQDTLGRLTSSTPEAQKEVSTPRSSKKGRVAKRARQNSRSSRTNGIARMSPTVLASMQEAKNETDAANDSLLPEISTPSRQSARSLSILRNQTPVYDPSDALVGKECFAKWSDNKYYPGKVVSKSKGKFKVNFLDGKSKLLIEEFVIPMPKTLENELSVFATTEDDGYGSCGVIKEVEKVKDEVLYTVETDEGERIKVQIKDIFMTADQAQFLREMVIGEVKSPPSTPSMGKVTLDNVVEGTRRNKPSSAASTPKSMRSKGRSSSRAPEEPSSSGTVVKAKHDDTSASDSNFSAVHDSEVEGVQAELLDTPNDLAPKGPASRVKGKARNRKKSEDQEVIATLGPIPEAGSTLFKGMSFILTCAPLESLDRYKSEKRESAASETETENEAEWTIIAFVRERLTAQLTTGGGKVYDEFSDIPVDEYKNTKLITNVPNITAKSLLCLSVNIGAVNHRWVVRCCKDNKLVSTSEETLPVGWSFDKESYVDMYQRPHQKPLGHAVIVIPKIPSNARSIEFWQRVITNAGGVVRIIENQSEMFMEGTVVLANEKCPTWMKDRAAEWKIPLVTTTWLVQSLIEGKMMPYDAHPLYQHKPKKSKD